MTPMGFSEDLKLRSVPFDSIMIPSSPVNLPSHLLVVTCDLALYLPHSKLSPCLSPFPPSLTWLAEETHSEVDVVFLIVEHLLSTVRDAHHALAHHMEVHTCWGEGRCQ